MEIGKKAAAAKTEKNNLVEEENIVNPVEEDNIVNPMEEENIVN